MQEFEITSPWVFMLKVPFLTYLMLVVPLAISAIIASSFFYPMDAVTTAIASTFFAISLYFCVMGVVFVQGAMRVPLQIKFNGELLELITMKGRVQEPLTKFHCRTRKTDWRLPALMFPPGSTFLEIQTSSFVALVSRKHTGYEQLARIFGGPMSP